MPVELGRGLRRSCASCGFRISVKAVHRASCQMAASCLASLPPGWVSAHPFCLSSEPRPAGLLDESGRQSRCLWNWAERLQGVMLAMGRLPAAWPLPPGWVPAHACWFSSEPRPAGLPDASGRMVQAGDRCLWRLGSHQHVCELPDLCSWAGCLPSTSGVGLSSGSVQKHA